MVKAKTNKFNIFKNVSNFFKGAAAGVSTIASKVSEIASKVSATVSRASNKVLSFARNHDIRVDKIFIIILLIVLALPIVLVYTKVASYSIISNDDFTHWTQLVEQVDTYVEGDTLHNAIEYAKFDCARLGGRYSAMFLQIYYGIRPGIDYLQQQKMIMVANVTLFFLSILALSFSLAKNVIMNQRSNLYNLIFSLLVFNFAIYMLLFNYFYYQVFTWFSAATSYTFPLSFFFLSVAFLLNNIHKTSFLSYVVSFIFIVFAMGGNVGTCVLGLSLISIIVLYLVIAKLINLRLFLLLIQYYIFGAINIFSPGNFIRRNIQSNGEKVNLVNVLNIAFSYLQKRLLGLANKPLFIVIVLLFAALIAVTLVYNNNKRVNYKMCIASLFLLLVPIITSSILAIGFNKSYYEPYDRVCFLIDLTIVIVIIVLSINVLMSILLLLIGIIKNENEAKVVFLTLSLLLTAIFMYKHIKAGFSLDGIHYFEVLEDLMGNKYKEYYTKFADVMNKLEQNRNSLSVNVPAINGNVRHFYKFSYGGQSEFFNIKNLIIH